MAENPDVRLAPDLLSRQVTGSRYFFLEQGAAPGKEAMLVMGGCEQCDPDYVIDRPGYTYHLIEYVAAGRGEIVLPEGRRRLGPGTVFSIAPEMPCRMTSDASAPMTKYFFALAGPAIVARLKSAGLAPGEVLQLPHHAEIRGAAEELVREGRRATGLAPAICAAWMELFLLKVAEASLPVARRSRAQENFERCKALLDGPVERYATLAELARDAGLDVSSVCRLFRRFHGGSPYQYLLRRKMTVAAELLLDRGCAVKEAAMRVGFADPFHFARCFKAVHGVPPSQLNLRQARTGSGERGEGKP